MKKFPLAPLLLFLGGFLVSWLYQTPPSLGDDLNYWASRLISIRACPAPGIPARSTTSAGPCGACAGCSMSRGLQRALLLPRAHGLSRRGSGARARARAGDRRQRTRRPRRGHSFSVPSPARLRDRPADARSFGGLLGRDRLLRVAAAHARRARRCKKSPLPRSSASRLPSVRRTASPACLRFPCSSSRRWRSIPANSRGSSFAARLPRASSASRRRFITRSPATGSTACTRIPPPPTQRHRTPSTLGTPRAFRPAPFPTLYGHHLQLARPARPRRRVAEP